MEFGVFFFLFPFFFCPKLGFLIALLIKKFAMELGVLFGQTKGVKAKYMMKTDDDTFVRVDAVLSAIRKTNHTRSLLLGYIEFTSEPNRDTESKWYVDYEVQSGFLAPVLLSWLYTRGMMGSY
jgi:hypothetical protein